MCNVFNKVKKQNGESFAKVLRDHHNGIFEIPNLVEMVKNAGSTQESAEVILKYLMSLLNVKNEVVKKIEDPFHLLDKAGYSAVYANTLELQNEISKHFEASEKLCTFRDLSRYKNYYIVNCVKKNVGQIQRNDFLGNEKRQDDYGTSVISIQIAKTGGFISIKNRYNHAVEHCDNTFQSNPDNIIEGLSAALAAHFNVNFSTKGNALPNGYVLASEKIVKVESETGGIYYGERCYVKNGVLHEVSAEKGLYLFDNFVFDSKTKTFEAVDPTIVDCFPEVFNNAYGGSPTVYVKNHNIYDGDILLIGIDDVPDTEEIQT